MKALQREGFLHLVSLNSARTPDTDRFALDAQYSRCQRKSGAASKDEFFIVDI